MNTYFVENRARHEGALRLAGTASLLGCLFAKNRTEFGGDPAVSNVGYTNNIKKLFFFSNDLRCRLGAFLNFTDASIILLGFP